MPESGPLTIIASGNGETAAPTSLGEKPKCSCRRKGSERIKVIEPIKANCAPRMERATTRLDKGKGDGGIKKYSLRALLLPFYFDFQR